MSAVNQDRKGEIPRVAIPREPALREGLPRLQIPWRRIAVYVVLALGFFLLGAIPMWLRAREDAAERQVVQRELGLSQMENKLSAAAIDARRGEYEPARQTASDFFTALRNEMDRGAASSLAATQRATLTNLLAQRDDIITLLARSDPAAADRLSNLYVAFRKTMSGVQPQVSSAR